MTSSTASNPRPPSARRAGGGVDPDELARLEDERDFLLASLRDLEAEHDAGDLDDADYATLRDDYTARAAEVLRAIEADHRRLAEAPRASVGRRAVWLGVVAVALVLAVVLVVQGSGRRSGSDGLTGDLPRTRTGQLAEAQAKLADGDLDGALEIYDVVLDADPSDVEALTYSAWVGRMGELSDDEALARLDEALALDPSYPDAQVFRAMVLQSACRSQEAGDQLARVDGADLPPFMLQLVGSFGVEVADARFAEGDAQGANEVLDSVLRIDPDNLSALVRKGQLLGAVALAADGEDADLLTDRALESLDAAVAAAASVPDQLPAALLARAQVAVRLDRPDVAVADLDRLDDLDVPAELDAQVDEVRRAVG